MATTYKYSYGGAPMDSPGVQLPSQKGVPENVNELEIAQEKEGLAQYGIHLADNHYDHYIYSADRMLTMDTSAVRKPWEIGILEQFGPGVPIRCATVEGWDNPDFLFEVRAGIAYCTLNRPAANNAMNDNIGAGLHDSALILRNRPDIRMAVLTANGRMFCAGGDPKAFQQTGAAAIQDGEDANPRGGDIAGQRRLIEADEIHHSGFARDLYEWASLPQFTICCLNGSAMGAGVGLLSVCDMAIAVRTAHATLSEVKLGVIPSVISPHVMRTIGTANAKHMFCTAENVNMPTAMQMGLVQRTVNDVSEFPAVVKEISQKLQACAPGAVAAAKQTILDTTYQPVSKSLIEYTAKKYAAVRKTQECEEGMKALFEKKKPTWVDKAIQVKE